MELIPSKAIQRRRRLKLVGAVQLVLCNKILEQDQISLLSGQMSK